MKRASARHGDGDEPKARGGFAPRHEVEPKARGGLAPALRTNGISTTLRGHHVGRARARRGLAAAVLALAIAACGTSPEIRYFTLPSEPVASAAAPAFSVVVGPVTVPEVVDRPHFVLRAGDSRVDIVETARWAAPLKAEIPRVIADHLGRLLDARAWSSAQRASGEPDYRVLIDIQRFEMSVQDGALVQALWTVRPQGGAAPVSGRSFATEPAGADYEDLAAAHSRALAAVSRDIAAAIQALRAR